jgi:hypothetical protein
MLQSFASSIPTKMPLATLPAYAGFRDEPDNLCCTSKRPNEQADQKVGGVTLGMHAEAVRNVRRISGGRLDKGIANVRVTIFRLVELGHPIAAKASAPADTRKR